MVLKTKTPPELDNCRAFLQGQVKNLADRLFGPQGPPVGTSFAQLEGIALTIARQGRKQLLDLLLARQADALHRDLPEELRRCPSCARPTTAADPEPRLLHSRAATVEWLEPQRYCGRCRKAFFPQSKSLGIEVGHYSASLLDLIAYAGANKPSFREASLDLDKLGGLCVHEKQVERLSKRIGAERLAERQAAVDQFLGLTLVQRCADVPAGVTAPGADQVAVIMADAGMLQLREAAATPPAQAPGEPTSAAPSPTAGLGEDEEADAAAADDEDRDLPPSGRHWHEDKVGLVLTMHSEVSDHDPCPEIPETFLDRERVAKIVRGLKKSAVLREEDQPTSAEPEENHEAPVKYEGPQLHQRQVVASRRSWPLFGVLLACVAWLSGFAQAPRRAFVADGARAIWRVWRRHFPQHVPILDFIHALSYVHAAARAVAADGSASWRLYVEWIRGVWQGNVQAVIEQLRQWQQQHGQPQAGDGETSARRVVAKSLRYLVNNAGKMKYAEYRQAGLPIVSSLVESMVKQISRRVKGTEKFWGEEGAEAILQLRADYLSDGAVMEGFWKRRQAAATGQRLYRTNA
jgi:hypothetical protein